MLLISELIRSLTRANIMVVKDVLLMFAKK
jgi:hypothetical protein